MKLLIIMGLMIFATVMTGSIWWVIGFLMIMQFLTFIVVGRIHRALRDVADIGSDVTKSASDLIKELESLRKDED